MRRHLLLLALIVALVVVAALLRSRGPEWPRTPATPSQAPLAEAASSIPDGENPDSPSLPPPAPLEPDKVARPSTPEKRAPFPPPKIRVTVVDADGNPVGNAVVVIVRLDSRGRTKVDERRTEEDGSIEVVREYEMYFYAYKVAVGAGAAGPIKNQAALTLRFDPCMTLRVRCVSTHDVPLYAAGVRLTTELYFGEKESPSAPPVPITALLPPRTVKTDAEGVAAFSGAFVAGPAKARSQLPGIRHIVEAEWNTLKAKETVTTPSESVDLFLR